MSSSTAVALGHNQPEQDPSNLRCSDIGNAEAFAKQHKDKLRYSYDQRRWLYWDGSVWKVDSEAHLERLAEETVRSFLSETSDMADRGDRQDFQKWTLRSADRQRLKAMVEQARHRLNIEQSKLDRDPMLLNLTGHTVDLNTGKVRSSNAEDYSTKQASVSFNSEAEYPLWHAFLYRIMGGSIELMEYLQRAVGYSLTGKTTEQCFFIAHGAGANGKSVFLNLIRDLVGSYGINIPMDTLMAQKFKSGNSNDLAMMHGARLGTAMEGELGQKLSEAKVKQLTGGDEITARFLYKEFFQFKPILKIWMATNHKPQITGDDPAIWRRVHLIPFNVVIPPEERDGDLAEKLRKELPGILNWSIHGAVKWAKEGLNAPQEVLSATDEYRSEMDTFALFCDEIITKEPGGKTNKMDLNNAYELWVSIEGGEHLKPAAINQRMKQMGYEEGRGSQGRFWKNISLSDHGFIGDNDDF